VASAPVCTPPPCQLDPLTPSSPWNSSSSSDVHSTLLSVFWRNSCYPVGSAMEILPTILATPTGQLDIELTLHPQYAVARHNRRKARSQQAEFHSLRFDSSQEHFRRASAQYSSGPRLPRHDIQDAVDEVRSLRWRNLSLANSRRHNVHSALQRQSHPVSPLTAGLCCAHRAKFLLQQAAVKLPFTNVLSPNLSST